MNEYEINRETLAIIPFKNKTKVYESNAIFFVDKPAKEIIEESCEFFGSSLEGRQKGTTNMIGVSHKAPIVVEETKELIFFPTASPRLEKCAWVSLANIENYYSQKKQVFIEFKNKQIVQLDISFGILDNQILRATRLESVLRKRKGEK